MRAEKDPLINVLQRVIRLAVRILAVLMTLVIFWGVGDVVWMLYSKLKEPPFLLLNISDILATFGAFMAVLIAIEIFVNITMYLKDGASRDYIQIVLATAIMAIARKVIILDFNDIEWPYVMAAGVVILALTAGYRLAVLTPEGDGSAQSNPVEHP